MAAVAVNLNAAMSAAQAVGEFLQSPDHLLKVIAFCKKLKKEKALINTRLKSTRSHIQSIKDEIQVFDVLCSDPKNTVGAFDQISWVSICS